MRTRIRWGNIIIVGHRTLRAVQQQVAAVVVLLLVVLAVCAERGYGAIQEHLVTNLPGQPVASFRQYAVKRLGGGGELGLLQNTHTHTQGIGRVFFSSGKCNCPWPFFSVCSAQTTPS
jgi:hypothetical protein